MSSCENSLGDSNLQPQLKTTAITILFTTCGLYFHILYLTQSLQPPFKVGREVVAIITNLSIRKWRCRGAKLLA